MRRIDYTGKTTAQYEMISKESNAKDIKEEKVQLIEEKEEVELEIETKEEIKTVNVESVEKKSRKEKLKAKCVSLSQNKRFQQIMNPSLIALILALLIGVVPPFKKAFHGTKAPLKYIDTSLDSLKICNGSN